MFIYNKLRRYVGLSIQRSVVPPFGCDQHKIGPLEEGMVGLFLRVEITKAWTATRATRVTRVKPVAALRPGTIGKSDDFYSLNLSSVLDAGPSTAKIALVWRGRTWHGSAETKQRCRKHRSAQRATHHLAGRVNPNHYRATSAADSSPAPSTNSGRIQAMSVIKSRFQSPSCLPSSNWGISYFESRS